MNTITTNETSYEIYEDMISLLTVEMGPYFGAEMKSSHLVIEMTFDYFKLKKLWCSKEG